MDYRKQLTEDILPFWLEHAIDWKNGDLSIYALVEDGMFEASVMYPVALYAEMLWDCREELKVLMKSVALRSYVQFV